MIGRYASALVVIAIAWLAMGTSYSVPRVDGLVERDRSLHAIVADDGDFHSRDGRTWEAAPELAEAIASAHQPRTELRDPEQPGRVYRLERDEVLVSEDDGRTWTRAWAIPEHRRRFVSLTPLRSAWPRDIAPVPGDPATIVIAMGTDGVLVRTADGGWTQHAVGDMRPTKWFAEPDDLPGLLARGQWAYGVTAALLAAWLASLVGWRLVFTRARRGRDELAEAWGRGLLETTAAVLPLGLVVPSLAVGQMYPHEWLLLTGASAVGCVLVTLMLRRGWRRMGARLGGPALAIAALCGAAGLGLLFAWDLGRTSLVVTLSSTGVAIALAVLASAIAFARRGS